MKKSPRCRKCNHKSCMRLKTAEALLLERKGKMREAFAAWQDLAKEQPYNLYARIKLIYKT